MTSSTRLVLAPLTTTFTAPPQCSAWGVADNNVSTTQFYLAQSCTGGEPRDASTCWPPALTTLSYSAPLAGYGIYSPGLICPSGYYSACTQLGPGSDLSKSTIQRSFSFQFPPLPGETVIGCCPQSLTCTSVGGYGWQTCGNLFSTSAISVGSCDKSATSYIEISSVSIKGDPKTQLWGPLVQIVFKASDYSSFYGTTFSSSTTLSSSANAAATTSIVATSSGTSDGLTTGAKIGIGVGVPLAILLAIFIGCLVFICRRRRKRHNTGEVNYRHELTSHENIKKHLPGPPVIKRELLNEVSGNEEVRAELDTMLHQELHELEDRLDR